VKPAAVIPPAELQPRGGNLREQIVTARSRRAGSRRHGGADRRPASKEEFARAHLRGAVNLPATELTDEALKRLVPTPQTRIVIYCDDNLMPTRRIALTTICNPAIYQLGYHNLYVLERCAFAGLQGRT